MSIYDAEDILKHSSLESLAARAMPESAWQYLYRNYKDDVLQRTILRKFVLEKEIILRFIDIYRRPHYTMTPLMKEISERLLDGTFSFKNKKYLRLSHEQRLCVDFEFCQSRHWYSDCLWHACTVHYFPDRRVFFRPPLSSDDSDSSVEPQESESSIDDNLPVNDDGTSVEPSETSDDTHNSRSLSSGSSTIEPDWSELDEQSRDDSVFQ